MLFVFSRNRSGFLLPSGGNTAHCDNTRNNAGEVHTFPAETLADVRGPGAGQHSTKVTEHTRKAARGGNRFLHGYAGCLHTASQVLRTVHKEADKRSEQGRPEELVCTGHAIKAPATGGQNDQVNNIHLGAAALEEFISQVTGNDTAGHTQERHPFHSGHGTVGRKPRSWVRNIVPQSNVAKRT